MGWTISSSSSSGGRTSSVNAGGTKTRAAKWQTAQFSRSLEVGFSPALAGFIAQQLLCESFESRVIDPRTWLGMKTLKSQVRWSASKMASIRRTIRHYGLVRGRTQDGEMPQKIG